MIVIIIGTEQVSNANGASSNPPNGPTGDEFNAPLTVVAGNTYVILVDYYTNGSTGYYGI